MINVETSGFNVLTCFMTDFYLIFLVRILRNAAFIACSGIA